jgi:hypothetical protein
LAERYVFRHFGSVYLAALEIAGHIGIISDEILREISEC